MFLMALEWGGTKYAWNSATVIGLLCGAAGTLVIFAIWEYRLGDDAMIPYPMLRKREVWSSCMVIALFFGGLLTFTYYLPIYFQAVKGVAPSPSGVFILPGILSQMLMAVVSGVLGEFPRFEPKTSLTRGQLVNWDTISPGLHPAEQLSRWQQA
jgi:hypothetical protein